MKNPIRTLADLEREQEKLKLQMEVAKHAFAQGMVNTRKQAGRFLLGKMALPASLAGLASLWLRGNRENGKPEPVAEQPWWQKALPVIIPILESIAGNPEGETTGNENGADSTHRHP